MVLMQEELANKEIPIEDEDSGGLAMAVVVWSIIITSPSFATDYAYTIGNLPAKYTVLGW